MGQGCVEGLSVLSGQKGAHWFYSALDGHRYFVAQLGKGLVNTYEPCLNVDSVLGGFQQQHVHAAFHQAQRLLPVGFRQLVKGYAAGNGNCLGGGAH